MSTRRTYTYKDNPELCKKLQDGDNNAAELICCVNMSLARKCADNAARIYGQDWRNDFLQLQQRIKETFFYEQENIRKAVRRNRGKGQSSGYVPKSQGSTHGRHPRLPLMSPVQCPEAKETITVSADLQMRKPTTATCLQAITSERGSSSGNTQSCIRMQSFQ